MGQYQHDLNQAELGRALAGVVERVVNRVGVDLNTASASLLGYVSGITPTVAKNTVAYREEQYDKLAQVVREGLDMELVYRILDRRD